LIKNDIVNCNIHYRMTLSNTEIADNIINLLQKAKENEAFDDNTTPLKLFNKIVKAGMKGQTKINIKVSNKAPSAYNLFVKEKMSEVKAEYPAMTGAEIFKKIGALWTEQNPKKAKEPSKPKEPKEPKEVKAVKAVKAVKEVDNTIVPEKTDNKVKKTKGK
jgi:hypothetical protein